MVTIGSNNFGCEPLVQIRTGRGTNKKTVYKPTNIFQYNKNMGGVDLLDYFVNVYRPRIRSKKWPLFQYSRLLSLHSAMKLYHERSGGEERSTREKGFLVFIRNVHKTLFGKYKKDRCRGLPHELGRGGAQNCGMIALIT